MVRIPESTPDMNLMAGFDLRTWLLKGMLLKPADTGAMNTLPRQPAAATAQEAAGDALFLFVNPAD